MKGAGNELLRPSQKNAEAFPFFPGAGLDAASVDFKFTAAVAAFGMILRDSPHKGAANIADVLNLANAGLHQTELGTQNSDI